MSSPVRGYTSTTQCMTDPSSIDDDGSLGDIFAVTPHVTPGVTSRESEEDGLIESPLPQAPPVRRMELGPEHVLEAPEEETPQVVQDVVLTREDVELVVATCPRANYPGGRTPEGVQSSHDVLRIQLQRMVNVLARPESPRTWAGQTHYSGSVYSCCMLLGYLYRNRGLLPAPSEKKVGKHPQAKPLFVKATALDFANFLTNTQGSDFPRKPPLSMGLSQEAQEMARHRVAAEEELYEQVRNIWKVASGQQAAADETLRVSSKERVAHRIKGS